jgi:hypothetical protein
MRFTAFLPSAASGILACQMFAARLNDAGLFFTIVVVILFLFGFASPLLSWHIPIWSFATSKPHGGAFSGGLTLTSGGQREARGRSLSQSILLRTECSTEIIGSKYSEPGDPRDMRPMFSSTTHSER